MTEKRFTINGKEIIQNKQVWCMANSEHCADVIATAMNELIEENEQLKQELQRIYDVATLKKARDIVDKIYDDLLYETSEKSDYARNKVLECLEKLDEFGDELE